MGIQNVFLVFNHHFSVWTGCHVPMELAHPRIV